MIQYEKFIFNLFGENTYLVWDDASGEALILDAGCASEGEQQKLAEAIASRGLKPTMAFCTHAHPDHVAGVEWVRKHYGIPVALHADDNDMALTMNDYGARFGFKIEPLVADIDLAANKTIRLGESVGEVIHTPGHSRGGVCLYFGSEGLLFSGDTLFAGSIGRTDLYGGDYDALMASIVEKVLPLGRGVKVLPGHGPESSISREIDTNPFIGEVLDGGFNKPYNE